MTEGENYVRWMREVGFLDVKTHYVKLPLRGWPAHPRLQQVGLFNRLGTY